MEPVLGFVTPPPALAAAAGEGIWEALPAAGEGVNEAPAAAAALGALPAASGAADAGGGPPAGILVSRGRFGSVRPCWQQHTLKKRFA